MFLHLFTNRPFALVYPFFILKRICCEKKTVNNFYKNKTTHDCVHCFLCTVVTRIVRATKLFFEFCKQFLLSNVFRIVVRAMRVRPVF